MQLWVTSFLWYATCDSLLNPPQNHLRFIVSYSRSTKYHVVVWCSPGLIPFLVKVVIDAAQNITIEDHCLEEIMEFL